MVDLASPTSAAGRKALKAQGKTTKWGGFPIPNVDYLKRAMSSIGRTPPARRPAVRALIRKRAKALGATSLLKNPVWQAASKTPDELLELANHYKTAIRDLSLEQLIEGEMLLAGTLPVASASDGPRVVKSSSLVGFGGRLGLQPHQAKAYARMRKRGVKHATAIKFARRTESRANNMGTAAKIGSGTGSQAYARTGGVSQSGVGVAGTASTAARGQLGQSSRPNRMSTRQQALFVPQKVVGPTKSGAGLPGGEGRAPGKAKLTRSAIPGVRASTATPPGGKLLRGYPQGSSATRTGISAGKYTWPDNKGQGKPPRTPVSVGAGFKTPSNLVVQSNIPSGENKSGKIMQPASNSAVPTAFTQHARLAYGKLRGLGISHAAAAKAVSQYYGSGAPKNSLGLRWGGSQTNLRMKQSSGMGRASTLTGRAKGQKVAGKKSMSGVVRGPATRTGGSRRGGNWYRTGGVRQAASMSGTTHESAFDLAAATGNPLAIRTQAPGEPGVTGRTSRVRGGGIRRAPAGLDPGRTPGAGQRQPGSPRSGAATRNPRPARVKNPGEPSVTSKAPANKSRMAMQGQQPGGPGPRKNVPDGQNVTANSGMNQGIAAGNLQPLVDAARKIGASLTMRHLQAAQSAASGRDYRQGVVHLSRAHETARQDGNVQLMNGIAAAARTFRQATP